MNEEEFLHFYDKEADGVFRHCHVCIADRERSKELMYEAFRDMWSFIAQGNKVDAPKIHLYRTIDALIQNQPLEKKKSSVVEAILGKPLSELHRLSSSHLRLSVLHFIDGFSAKEMETMLGGSAEEYERTLRDVESKASFLSMNPTHA